MIAEGYATSVMRGRADDLQVVRCWNTRRHEVECHVAQHAAETNPARLGPAKREETWQRLGNETFDVVIIGGGEVGAGTALAAATRGLWVVFVVVFVLALGLLCWL